MRASFSDREITRRPVDLFSSPHVGVVGAAAKPTMRRYELTVGARIDTAAGIVATRPPDPVPHRPPTVDRRACRRRTPARRRGCSEW